MDLKRPANASLASGHQKHCHPPYGYEGMSRLDVFIALARDIVARPYGFEDTGVGRCSDSHTKQVARPYGFEV